MATQRPRGQHIADFRRALGYSQLELAMKAGVSERTVRNAERGRPIKHSFLGYIAGGLNVPLAAVIEDETAALRRLQDYARGLRAELQSSFTALQASAEAPGRSMCRPTPCENASLGATLLNVLSAEMRLQGINLPALLKAGRALTISVEMDPPSFNDSSVVLRGRITLQQRDGPESLRWALICEVSEDGCDHIEAFCKCDSSGSFMPRTQRKLNNATSDSHR